MTLSLDRARLLVRSLQSAPMPIQAVPPAPCTQACPAGINVKAYVSLIAEGRFSEALEVVRERCPLPGICGRICHHPCETACIRKESDQPVAIRALKRFIADVEIEVAAPPPAAPPDRPERIAIVGAGPAGITAAYDLARSGFRVTIFESEPEPGGMLRYGIADYRLPPEVLDHEIDVVRRAGVEIRTGCRIGREMTLAELLSGGFWAVLLTVGAQLGRRLRLTDQECSHIQDALTFLRRVNHGERSPLGGKVVVIGGGSTAVEAARTALRLGAHPVEIVYRRHWQEMPASAEEVEQARLEGVELSYLKAPTRAIVEDGELRGIECQEVALGEPDASGRRRPIPIPGTESVVAADLVLLAVGQQADLGFLSDEIHDRLAGGDRLTADPETLMTGLHGVFAAGDVVTGPATVIDAIAAGHRAAASISRFLATGAATAEGAPETVEPPTEYGLPDAPTAPSNRLEPPRERPVAGREFAETELAFAPELAVSEAQRCLRCGPCGECRICASSCGRRHIWLQLPDGVTGEPSLHLIRAPGAVARSLASSMAPASLIAADGFYDVEVVPAQVRVVEELCRGCSRCAEVCGFEAITRLDADNPESAVRVEPARCRGCNLCVAACPTDALVPALPTGLPADLASGPTVVIGCRQRAAELGPAIERLDREAVTIWLRCSGEIDAGALLDLCERGARRIVVAGCAADRCRYGRGARMAAAQAARAQTILRLLGADVDRIVTDGSAGADTLELLGLESGGPS